MTLVPLAFSAPLALIGLALLPVIYYLLRITPPRPRQIPFPPLKLILDMEPKNETPARTPWWLLALRLMIAGLIVLAMAGPIWNPQHSAASGREPLLVLLDDGWPAAPSWEQRLKVALAQVDDAARQGAPTAVIAASEGPREAVLSDGTHAAQKLRALKPVPYVPDRAALIAPLEHFLAEHPRAHLTWIADGLALGGTRAFAEKLAELAKNGQAEIVASEHSPAALAGAANEAGALNVNVLRATNDGPRQGWVRALDLKGASIGDAGFDFGSATETQARFDLPIELRNDIARIGSRRRAIGRRCDAARRALEAASRRHRQRRDGRRFAAAARRRPIICSVRCSHSPMCARRARASPIRSARCSTTTST